MHAKRCAVLKVTVYLDLGLGCLLPWIKHNHAMAVTQTVYFDARLPTLSMFLSGGAEALFWLSGFSCTDENFLIKSGAQRAASSLGVALIAPDTSPRGLNIEGESDSWDSGVGDIPPWKDELESLVRGGVPMALKGELWQAFAGVRARRVENYYDSLLGSDAKVERNQGMKLEYLGVPEKWKIQIEKDLPRTFPGHPTLAGDGRDALSRILTAYTRHNPSVGYCVVLVQTDCFT